MNPGFLAVLGMAVCLLTGFLYEHRHTKRERRERHLRAYKYRREDRDRAVSFGRDLYYETGDPYLDPEAYDSAWEYAEGVREHLGLQNICDIDVGSHTATTEDGIRHRIALLRMDGIRVATLFCRPDELQTRKDPAGLPVTCLRCIMKEHEE